MDHLKLNRGGYSAVQVGMWAVGLVAVAAAIVFVVVGVAHWRTQAYFNTTMASGIAALMFGAILLVMAAIANKRATYAEFLQDCTQDHKRYECMLMWRASDRSSRDDDTVIIPVPMPGR